MKKTRFTAAFVLISALAAACSRAPQGPAGMPPSPVRTIKPTVSDVPVHREYPGMTMSVRTVDIIPRVTGWIDTQGFTNGQSVTDGQMLYVIDPRPYQVIVEKAKADIAVVEAELKNASDKVNRNRPLVEVSAISQEMFDQMLADQRTAEANLDAKHAALDDANLNLSFTRISSPLTGQISATNKYPGTSVTPQDTLVTVRQMDPLWVEFEPVDTDIPALRRMQLANDGTTQAALPGSTWARSGKVVFIDNSVNRETSTIRTRIEVPNADLMMAPGAYVTVKLKVDELKDAVSVPENVLTYQTAAATLWVVDAEGKAHQKVVKTGARGGAGIVITEGLAPDETVVIEGMQKLRDGSQTVSPEVMLQAIEGKIEQRMGKAAE